MLKDWTGNSKAVIAGIAPSNHSRKDREKDDFYATDPKAVDMLCDLEKFSPVILEPACGQGHIADVLKKRGYSVECMDLVDRGYEGCEICDFLENNRENTDVDIVTNPPYRLA